MTAKEKREIIIDAIYHFTTFDCGMSIAPDSILDIVD